MNSYRNRSVRTLIIAAIVAGIPTAIVLGTALLFIIDRAVRSPARLNGIVLDEFDRPISGVALHFRESEIRPVIPSFVFGPDYVVSSWKDAVSRSDGTFVMSWKNERLELVNAYVSGYSWEKLGSGTKTWLYGLDVETGVPVSRHYVIHMHQVGVK